MPGLKQVFIQPLTEVSLTPKDQVGDIRVEGTKKYKYVQVKNTSATVAGAAGDPVAYGAGTSDLENSLVVLDLTDAAAAPVGAGLLMAAVAGVAGTSYYCWIQIRGPAVFNPAAVGTAGTMVRIHATVDKTFAIIGAATEANLPPMFINGVIGAKRCYLICPD